jgi:hypothetical protein
MVSSAAHFIHPNGHIEFSGHRVFIEVQQVDPLSAVIAAENRDATRNLRFSISECMIKKAPPSTHWKDERPWNMVSGTSVSALGTPASDQEAQSLQSRIRDECLYTDLLGFSDSTRACGRLGLLHLAILSDRPGAGEPLMGNRSVHALRHSLFQDIAYRHPRHEQCSLQSTKSRVFID